jgi:hypothetical protein
MARPDDNRLNSNTVVTTVLYLLHPISADTPVLSIRSHDKIMELPQRLTPRPCDFARFPTKRIFLWRNPQNKKSVS